MPAIVWVVIVIVGLVAALLAVDWFTAGRSKRRLVRATDQNSDNAGVGYANIIRQGQSTQSQGNTSI
jgi:hypothetical protein